jgi:polyferredoxin
MNRLMIRRNVVAVTIILFFILFSIVNYIQPGMMYNPEGGIRGFGINQQSKTIFPIWLITIVLAIFSYVFVLIYLDLPKYQ